MKHTPLLIRILGGFLLAALMACACLHPLLTSGEAISMAALSKLGKPYVWGTFGPDTYDCSGLTKIAYEFMNVELIHSSQFVAYDDQYQTIEDPANLIPGDLIFFDTISDRDRADHVGVWLGLNRFVHASSSEKVVMVSELDEKWLGCYSWGKHIIDPYNIPVLNKLQDVLHAIKNPASEN